MSHRRFFLVILVGAFIAAGCNQVNNLVNPAPPTLTPLPTLTPIAPFEPNEFGDVWDTGSAASIGFDESIPAQIATLQQAHNWTFEGTAGSAVTITVQALGGSDPNMRLFDPNLQQIGADDDSNGELGALLTTTLPVDGVYTIRINMISIGQYELSLASQ